MAVAKTNRRWFLLIATAAITTLVMVSYRPTFDSIIVYEKEEITLKDVGRFPRQLKNWRGLTKNETDKLSVLGRILFLEENPPEPIPPKEENYKILLWKYGSTIENRHLKNFGSTKVDPFEYCSVKNCEITYNDAALTTADIVIFHLHRMKEGELPKRSTDKQIWAFLTDESPFHTFMGTNNLTKYNGAFNWSMTYRMDSDIPVPYGRTILRKNPLETAPVITKRRDVLIAVMGSNCGGNNKRWDYVKELQKYITVHVYGGCGKEFKNACKGHFKQDCPLIGDYLFYLAFENSNCDEYITEKLWWNAYEKNSIPIVMGATKASYAKLLPPNSYLNVDDYAHPKDLANHVQYLNNTGNYNDFYSWKADFQVLNEHGYFQSKSFHYCRVCEALHYNEKKTKVYQNLSQFWNVKGDCHPAWNA